MVIAVANQWQAYSSTAQTISELSAIDAPTRSLWVWPAAVYTALVMAFGWGVRMSAGRTWRLRQTGALLVAYGSLGLLWPFAPMHLREALAGGRGSASDTMHLALAGVSVTLMLLAIIRSSRVFGRRFRWYSLTSLVALCLCGVMTFLDAPRLSANLPTPWIGVWERSDVGVFLLWVVVLAGTLLTHTPSATPIAPSPSD
jgi:hypothetical protein